MRPILLSGTDAFSAFRLDAIKSQLAERLPGADGTAIDAKFIYLINAPAPLDGQVLERAMSLLGATGEAAGCDGFFATPRKGTISPWSSKATDIFRNCGIDSVARVERGVRFRIESGGKVLGIADLGDAATVLYDRMTEGIYDSLDDFFDQLPPAPGRVYDVLGKGIAALEQANVESGLALSADEMRYLCDNYTKAGRNPTDTELVMFGQVNSEHCRHKIFNTEWIIDGVKQDSSLFQMIKNTYRSHPEGTLVAYKDNSGVVEGFDAQRFAVDGSTRAYGFIPDRIDMLMKVETHNHPTAISPFPGAATGVGGEIRDESATGTGSKTKAGIAGFMVSNLNLPDFRMKWEKDYAEFPKRLATPLQIMIDGPIGGAAFGNEFGRPQLCGFFRTYEEEVAGRYRGYHKPIMLAGGMGNIRHGLVHKREVTAGSLIVQIGGPALRIGLGGGAASSMVTGSNDEALDFNSVQRGNAEMERRCQEVIDACVAMGDQNPILSIHDIGAGGLSNGCPELIEATGGTFDLRTVHNEEPSMSPMEIWCCEAQERYVLAIRPEHRTLFERLCERERCPVAFIGEARDDGRLVLNDTHFNDKPIDMDIRVLLGKPPRMLRDVTHENHLPPKLDLSGVSPAESFERILQLPTVADKTFLITITDRTVTGQVHRDQMVGRYQLPVADNAVTITDYVGYTGEAMATGERTPVALIGGPASGRLAVAEAITNIASAAIGKIGNIKLSANWMCACGEPGEDAELFDTVKAVGMEFCPELGVSIPVGKDSLSMRTVWDDSKGASHRQVAPLSLIVSAFSPVSDVRKTVTPDLKPGKSSLLLADLGQGRNRLGASALSQVWNQVGDVPADMDDPRLLRRFFEAVQELVDRGLLLAYHDRSDGGVAVTLAEMAISGGRGVEADLGEGDPLSLLFSEEPGAVLQVADADRDAVLAVLGGYGLSALVRDIGVPTDGRSFTVKVGGTVQLDTDITKIRRLWSGLTCAMQSRRDNPECARQEYDNALDESDPGLSFKLTYDPDFAPVPAGRTPDKPRMAILREQGINGQVEMAAAFALAGFESVDVHMTDLLSGRVTLDGFSGLVACGGFSYGDVLGAGSGWARSILYNDRLLEMFRRFFARPDTFTLGVCNGCQMVSQLKDIIPGAAHWPAFRRNLSEQFEARFATLEVLDSPSVLLKGMAGSRIPIAVAHGEGRVEFDRPEDAALAIPALRFVDGRGAATERYPWNPNGSKGGLTSFTSEDGRATIMMPHPERGFRSVQLSYRPSDLFTAEAGPWMRMFRNAYAFATGNV
ncbi:MAG: phosphoribosylformylglycinamidine synthase [Kiritimatiellae bacterium]|nr:phosphoribosylformylglycinamidine synthase [Kiritimatiellia bacterium]